ncbi:MAG: trypsin-like peptidase domain-containing protein, partial [Planctomycetota bacterium]
RSCTRLGRDPSNDISFDPYLDRDASGFHAEVFEEEDKLWVRDVGSTNGTYVNGKKNQRAVLHPGDILGFGRNGPKVELLFDNTPGAKGAVGESEAAGSSSEGSPKEERRRSPGVSTVQAIVREAVEKERGKRRNTGGTAVYVREAVREAVNRSSRRNRVVLGGVLALFILTIGVGVVVFVTQWNRIRDQEERIRRSEKTAEEAHRTAKSTEELFLSARDEFRDQFFTAQEEEAERKRELEESRKRIARLESKIPLFAKDEKQLEAIRGELAKARNERALFQEIQEQNDPSILLIYTAFKVRDKEGKEKQFQAFGTGFIATPEGHVITNKHVVQPWKFAKFKKILDRKGLQVMERTVLVAAWRCGSRVYRKKDARLALNLNAGYNTKPLGNLEIHVTAPDHMDWVSLAKGESAEPVDESPQKIHAHVHDNNDLAILKIEDRFAEFRPVKLAKEAELKSIKKLDAVLSIGFPRGGALLEKGVAETSGSRGDVRKFETSILISAPIIGGNSGGPVFNERGSVIGVSTRTIRGAETFGFCIPIQHAVKLLPPEFR